jgi:hypothetical protein
MPVAVTIGEPRRNTSLQMRTYNLEMNARLQAQAILLGGKITYIEPEEPGTITGRWRRPRMGFLEAKRQRELKG